MGQTSEAIATLKTDIADTRDLYHDYYAKKGADRNSLLENPGVLFQVLAQDAAVIRALRSAGLDPQTSQVLDVGCGDGASLWLLMRLGFEAATGIPVHRWEVWERIHANGNGDSPAGDPATHDA